MCREGGQTDGEEEEAGGGWIAQSRANEREEGDAIAYAHVTASILLSPHILSCACSSSACLRLVHFATFNVQSEVNSSYLVPQSSPLSLYLSVCA